jgi:hypothetical protein
VLIVAKITQRTAGEYAEYLEGKARASELGDYYLKDGSGSRLRVAGRAERTCSGSTPTRG